jgi:hypothetical protein
MRPITISLDATTWELAKKKPNFSAWVRDKLRSERNKMGEDKILCTYCGHKWPKKSFYDHICIPGWKNDESEEDLS